MVKQLFIYDLPTEIMKRKSFSNHTVFVNPNLIHQYCIGCFGCWLKTPGTCVIKDDYQHMGKKLSEVDELVIISKATFGSYSSAVKNVLDRSISYVLPFFEIRNGEMHHGERYHNNLKVTAVFYGDMTETEKNTARNVVNANAVNLNAKLVEVYFVDKMEDVLGVVS